MKFISYVFFSFLLLLSNVYYAYYTKHQFYPTILFLVSSKASIIIAGNMLLACSLVIARIVKSLYFGNLREAEVEILIEKAKYSIIDTCLALTIFRNELSSPIFMLFGFLILMKLLHKLAKARLEYFEQIAPIPYIMNVRMGLLLISMVFVDFLGVYFSVLNILTKGKSVIILFGFEFGLLLNYSLNLAVRYVIQVVDGRLENGLTSRGFYILTADLLSEVVKVITYIAFFALICMHYGLPFHLIRDVYAAYFSFQRKLTSFIKYWQLVKNLDSRFPYASPEELENAGDCLVCRERMERGKKLPCGHVFHLDCLKSWLQHQQSCPLCRSDIPADGGQFATVPATQGPVGVNGHVEENVGAVGEAPVVEGEQMNAQVNVNNLPQSESTTENLSFEPSPNVQNSISSSAFPQFFVVTCKDDLPILLHPSVSGEIIRTVKQGTILFISSRLLQSDGRHWLRTPDGWILEERLISPNHIQLLLLPMALDGKKKCQDNIVGQFNSAKADLSIASRVPSSLLEQYPAPFSKIIPDDKDISQSSRTHERDNNHFDLSIMQNSRSALNRLEDIRLLQQHLREMTRTMNILTERMIDCQKSISKLVQEEIDEATEKNIKVLSGLTKDVEE